MNASNLGYLSIQTGSNLADELDILRIMRDNAETTSTSSDSNSEVRKFCIPMRSKSADHSSWETDPSRVQPGFTTTGYLRPLVPGSLSSTFGSLRITTPALEITAPKGIDELSRVASVTSVPTVEAVHLHEAERAGKEEVLSEPGSVQLRIPVDAIESLLAQIEAQMADSEDDSTPGIFARSEMMQTSDQATFAEGTTFTSMEPTYLGRVPVELWIGDEMMPGDPGQQPELDLFEVILASRT